MDAPPDFTLQVSSQQADGYAVLQREILYLILFVSLKKR